MTLVEFLTTRLDEDEAAARAGGQYDTGPLAWSEVGAISEVLTIGTDRVLREVEAKRRIVAEHEVEVSRGPAGAREDFVARHGGILDAYGAALRILASVYSDHSDYRDEWRP